MKTISIFLSIMVLAVNFMFRQGYMIFKKARYAYGMLGLGSL